MSPFGKNLWVGGWERSVGLFVQGPETSESQRGGESPAMKRWDFEKLVLEALEQLPEEIALHMDNVDVVVQAWPSEEQLDSAGLDDPHELLGLYEGIPLTERDSYNMALPDRVNIFQGPIEAISSDRETLVQEIRDTVLHEIAHHFGIDDRRLEELGRG